MLGDQTGYSLGIRMGRPYLAGRSQRIRSGVAREEVFYQRYGPFSVVAARFIPWVRTFPFAAGVAVMNRGRFVGQHRWGLCWAAGLVALGYFAYQFPVLRTVSAVVAAVVIVGSLLVGLVTIWRGAASGEGDGKVTLGVDLGSLTHVVPQLTAGLTDYLDPSYLLDALGTFALIGVIFIIFAECGLLIGFFLPGDSLLFITGLFIATGAIATPSGSPACYLPQQRSWATSPATGSATRPAQVVQQTRLQDLSPGVRGQDPRFLRTSTATRPSCSRGSCPSSGPSSPPSPVSPGWTTSGSSPTPRSAASSGRPA